MAVKMEKTEEAEIAILAFAKSQFPDCLFYVVQYTPNDRNSFNISSFSNVEINDVISSLEKIVLPELKEAARNASP